MDIDIIGSSSVLSTASVVVKERWQRLQERLRVLRIVGESANRKKNPIMKKPKYDTNENIEDLRNVEKRIVTVDWVHACIAAERILPPDDI
jgi:hypothetical protein